MAPADTALGIDIGGTFTKLALLDRAHTLLESGRLATRSAEGPRALVARCRAAVDELCVRAGRGRDRIAGAGVGIAGLIDQELGGLAASPNLPGWSGVPLREVCATTLDLETRIDNDATLYALGEALIGAGKGSSTVAVLTLGTGVGGGLVDRERVFHGARGMAAEFGHMALEIDRGPECACGHRGCLEAYVNAGAVVRRAVRMAGEGKLAPGPLLGAALRGGDLSARIIGEAAAAGDPLALAVFRETGRFLGFGIANLVSALNPDTVVIGGGVAMVGDPLLDEARRVALARVLPPLGESVMIVRAALGDQGGVLGAALLGFGP